MSTWKCPSCGAAITPVDPSIANVRCLFCRNEHSTSVLSLSGAGVPAMRRIQVDLDAAFATHAKEHAQRVKRALAIVGGSIALAAMLVGTLANHDANAQRAAVPTVVEIEQKGEAPPEPVAQSPAPTPAVPTPPEPLVTFGGEGTGEGRFTDALHLAVDREGTVYVADRTGRIQAFDGAGRLLRTLTASTHRRPTNALTADITQIEGLAIDANGKLLISIGYDLLRLDPSTGRVEHTTSGRLGRTCFRDLSVDPRGNVYAASACTDTDRYALLRLDPSLRVVTRLDEPNEYERASTGRLAVDGTGHWYVPYGYQSEIRVLEQDGSVHTRFGRRGNGDGELASYAIGPIALDPTGRVYVRDSSTLRVFDANGAPLGTFDSSAAGHLRDFAIGSDGSIWVLTGDGRVARFAPFAPT